MTIISSAMLNELNNSADQYKVIGISAGHLSENDKAFLEKIAEMEEENAMWDGVPFAYVGKRTEGYFVKMYDTLDLESCTITLEQDQLFTIAQAALNAGYRMIEFDCDADEYECFTSYSA